jgi:anti-repressor protein
LNNLLGQAIQTPIEIALQIDDNGMTTAKRLYEFLELEKKNYSRWSKSSILENEFAEENTDYFPFVINEEWGGQATTDYKLTAAFAKKLSMTAKSERGEEARDYFIKTEDKLKEMVIPATDLSPELQMFQSIFQAVAQQELRNKQIEQKADKALEASQVIKDTIIGTYDNWREEIKHLVSAIQRGSNSTYQDTYNNLYDVLEKRAKCDLSSRVRNGRKRLEESGASKTKVETFGRLDVIEVDARLKEIFTTIIKEHVIKYRVA